MKLITVLIAVFIGLITFLTSIGIGILIHRYRHLKRCTAIKQVYIVKIHLLHNPAKATVSDGSITGKIQLPGIVGFRFDRSRYYHLCNRSLDVLYNPAKPSEMRLPETRYINQLICGIAFIATSVSAMLILIYLLAYMH